MSYIITLDTGTTNTRVVLWDSKFRPAASAKSEVGVRNTAIDGSNRRLKAAVKECLERVLRDAGTSYDEVEAVIASGMITSNVGLVEIPHCVVPAGADDLAAAVQEVSLPDVCPIPIHFVPGVKNSGGPIGFGNFEAMDIMRGEEVESIALLEQYPRGKSYLLVLPGSHMKFVSVNTKGQITGCLTSISGELLASITNDTIIADAVGRQFVAPEDYDRSMVLLGCDTAAKSGVGRACFSARILSQFVLKDQKKLANYVLGAALQSDLTGIRHSDALQVGPETDVIIAGKDPLRRAMADLLEHDGYFAHVHVCAPKEGIPLSAAGAFLIAKKTGIL